MTQRCPGQRWVALNLLKPIFFHEVFAFVNSQPMELFFERTISLLSHGSRRLSAASERAFSTVSGTAIGWYWNVIQFSDQPHVSLRWCCNHLHQFPEMAKKSIQYIHYTVVKCIRRKFSQQYWYLLIFIQPIEKPPLPAQNVSECVAYPAPRYL